MAKAYPREFRDDVVPVAVARKGQSPMEQIAKDFGISEGCLHGWMKKADIEDGHRPGATAADQAEPSASGISPTTSPAHCSNQAASDPFYTLLREEPTNSRTPSRSSMPFT